VSFYYDTFPCVTQRNLNICGTDKGIEVPLCGIVMKLITAVFGALCFLYLSLPSFADQYVHGYTRSNGTYVQPYYRSSPDKTVTNNFSYKGNVNPYTGAVGTNRYNHDKTSPNYQGPDSHGRVGHDSVPDMPQGAWSAGQPQDHLDPGAISLCPPPHFKMTERDGCQPIDYRNAAAPQRQ